MATKIIKALVDGVVQNIEVEATISPEQMLSPEERLDTLEDKHEVVSEGNFLVGNGTDVLREATPDEVLARIGAVNAVTMTQAEFDALSDDESNANTLYTISDAELDYYTKIETDEKIDSLELITTNDIDNICGSTT